VAGTPGCGAARHKHGHLMGAPPPKPTPTPPPSLYSGNIQWSIKLSKIKRNERRRLDKKKSISPGYFNFKQDARIAGPDSGFFSLFFILLLHVSLQCVSEWGRGHNLPAVIKISLGVYDFKTVVKVGFNGARCQRDIPVAKIRAQL